MPTQAAIQPIVMSMSYKKLGPSLRLGDGVIRNTPAIFNFSSIELFASNAL